MNEVKPVVSVVIPVYNVEKYLEECLDSIVNQTYNNIEVITIDDKSTDNSINILEKYKKDFYINVIKLEKNNGQGYARNIGIKNAIGKYIMFVDADDFIEKNTIEELVSLIEKKNVDMVRFNGISFIDDYSNKKLKNYKFNNYLDEERVYDEKKLKKVYFSFNPSPCLYLIKKSILTNNNILFEEKIIHEDELFTTEVFLKVKKVLYKNEDYYKRRYRIDSTTTNKTIEQKKYSLDSYLKVINKIINIYKNEKLTLIQTRFLKYRRNILSINIWNSTLNKKYKIKQTKGMRLPNELYLKFYYIYVSMKKIYIISLKKLKGVLQK